MDPTPLYARHSRHSADRKSLGNEGREVTPLLVPFIRTARAACRSRTRLQQDVIPSIVVPVLWRAGQLKLGSLISPIDTKKNLTHPIVARNSSRFMLDNSVDLGSIGLQERARPSGEGPSDRELP